MLPSACAKSGGATWPGVGHPCCLRGLAAVAASAAGDGAGRGAGLGGVGAGGGIGGGSGGLAAAAAACSAARRASSAVFCSAAAWLALLSLTARLPQAEAWAACLRLIMGVIITPPEKSIAPPPAATTGGAAALALPPAPLGPAADAVLRLAAAPPWAAPPAVALPLPPPASGDAVRPVGAGMLPL